MLTYFDLINLLTNKFINTWVVSVREFFLNFSVFSARLHLGRLLAFRRPSDSGTGGRGAGGTVTGGRGTGGRDRGHLPVVGTCRAPTTEGVDGLEVCLLSRPLPSRRW